MDTERAKKMKDERGRSGTISKNKRKSVKQKKFSLDESQDKDKSMSKDNLNESKMSKDQEEKKEQADGEVKQKDFVQLQKEQENDEAFYKSLPCLLVGTKSDRMAKLDEQFDFCYARKKQLGSQLAGFGANFKLDEVSDEQALMATREKKAVERLLRKYFFVRHIECSALTG